MTRTGAPAPEPSQRVFLFLEGPSSPLFMKIADRLEAMGHACLRVNLNIGDQIFWRRRGGHAFRGRPENWPRWIEDFLARHRVTDLVLLGEERPYHQFATAAAKRLSIEIYVVEMGYLRPDWLTLERDGMSTNSHFPEDPHHILKVGGGLPEPDWKRRYSQTFLAEAAYDLLYNLPNAFLWFLYPHYRRHALYHPLVEYGGWVRKLLRETRRGREAAATIALLEQGQGPLFIFPLQLQTDFQLRAHSPYHDQQQAIREVLTSFSRAASPDARLVVKVHPLDNGLVPWAKSIVQEAKRLGIGSRVVFLDGGNLNALIRLAAGIVTINSTVGLHALQQRKPVKVLGVAMFDVERLTDHQSLDTFWQAPRPPDPDVCDAFFRLVAAAIQVRGNFYSKAGTDAGAEAIATRLDARTVNEPDAFIDPPPRKRPTKRARV
ncbi:capsular biosynthesis protein [Rhizobium sp. Leaf384]|uniref:capsule biosynthesis protein n=1 Tax=unclassified Rhizobium TaxID=2613769 RepID=UPI0007144D45|nr:MULTISPECIES: capsular biosynthesis protein [unclassified Rhizobium]KQS81023.1 capsular biosynthesis protein [Rhizobium sp. Leaf384]KQS86877.1 capsular biosynthesis protein [Rhizobium sp. Leaf383]